MIPIIKLRLKQFYNSYLKRFFNRNALIMELAIILFILGIFVGKAYGDEPIKKGSKYEVFLEAKVRIENKNLFDSTTTTTTTTTKPVVLYKKPQKIVSTTTVPAPETNVPVAPVKIYDSGSIEAMIAEAFPENPSLWIEIARCESHLNPRAYNKSGASGIFQIMMPLHSKLVNGNVFDPATNIRAARSLSRNGTSTAPWDASKHCWS